MKRIVMNNLDKKNFEILAKKVSLSLQINDILLLYGQLGAGKTFFVSKLCKYLNVLNIVNSPSYVILNEYTGKFKIFHYDLYRLSTEHEALEIGVLDRLKEGITIIEWPELVKDYITMEHINIFFQINNKTRDIIIESNIGGKIWHYLK
jgi:tRNA threonylcarbamoyladenosine biosynthesis protein TsaE